MSTDSGQISFNNLGKVEKNVEKKYFHKFFNGFFERFFHEIEKHTNFGHPYILLY